MSSNRKRAACNMPDPEYSILSAKAQAIGLSRSEYLRQMIRIADKVQVPHALRRQHGVATHAVSVRINERDRELLERGMQQQGSNETDYLRSLLYLDLEPVEDTPPTCIVIPWDASAMNRLAKELRHWGYQYNQAVHALNTVQMFIKRESVDYDWFSQTIDEIHDKLTSIEGARRDLSERVATLEAATITGGA